MTAIANLVHQTTTSTGTGDLALAVFNGRQSFNDAFSNGSTEDVFYYFISNRDKAGEWEVGTGHLSDAGTLVRDTVLEGSNGSQKVNFSDGTKDVTNALPASMLLSSEDVGNSVQPTAFTQSGSGAVARTVNAKLQEWVTPEDFGGYNWASTVLAAAASNAVLLRGGAMSASVAAVDVATLFATLPKLLVAPGSSLVVTLGAGVQDCSQALLLVGTELDAVRINGATPIAVTISGVNSVTSDTFNVTHWDNVSRNLNYHEVEYDVDTVSGVSVGQFLIVETTAAATDHELHRGAWEIIDVDAVNTRITVLHTGHTAPPTTSFTGSGVVLPTVIRFLNGSTMGFTALQAEDGAALGTLNNIAFVGTGRPVVDGERGPSGYDVPGGNGGVTGIIARDNATLEFGSRFVVSGFSGTNAISNRSGALITTGYSCNAARNGWSAALNSSTQAQGAVAAGNLIDGFIGQDTSYNFCTSSISGGNHRHGYISANNSSVNAASGLAKGNRGDGYNALLSAMNAIGSSAVKNDGYGLNATNDSKVRATSFAATGNTLGGLFADGCSTIEAASADADGNTGTDYSATNGAYISISGHDTTGSPTYSPPLDTVGPDGAFIRGSTATTRAYSAAANPMRLINRSNAASNEALRLESARSAPANADNVYQSLYVRDSANNPVEIARIIGYASSVTSGSVSGQLRIQIRTSGTLANEFIMTGTVMSPAAASGLALGSGGLPWNGLALGEGTAINWGNGAFTATQTGGTLALSGEITLGTDLALAHGGTGASTAEQACFNLGTWRLIASSGAKANHTGDTSETSLETVLIPPIGANGKIKVEHSWSFTGTNAKTPRIKLLGSGGATYYAPSITTNLSLCAETIIAAANSASAQKGHVPANVVTGVGGSGATLPTSTVDLTSGGSIEFTGQLTNTGENIALESYAVWVLFSN